MPDYCEAYAPRLDPRELVSTVALDGRELGQLGLGWHARERGRDGVPYRWSSAYGIVFLPPPAAPGSRIAVVLRGRPGTTVRLLAAGEERLAWNLPDAAWHSVVLPAKVVRDLVVGLVRIMTGKETPQLTGPVGIVKVAGQAASESWVNYLYLLGVLSAYFGGFNLVPFPALDGGRLMFLSYEAVTRRRPNARIEAHVHAAGLILLIALILVVTAFDIRGN